jgi:hypothetical protein
MGHTNAQALEDQIRRDPAGVTIGIDWTASTRAVGHAYAPANPWLRSRHYNDQRLPIDSGLTEAAYTIGFAQRLKRAGISWTLSDGQGILALRVSWCSGGWHAIHSATWRQNRYPSSK